MLRGFDKNKFNQKGFFGTSYWRPPINGHPLKVTLFTNSNHPDDLYPSIHLSSPAQATLPAGLQSFGLSREEASGQAGGLSSGEAGGEASTLGSQVTRLVDVGNVFMLEHLEVIGPADNRRCDLKQLDTFYQL